ncbi:Uncharacterised protein [Mycobacteroides abscessus subsp. abscessus]|nr:Uncharacterised protein [Mycobacteroides abscessus subsp. abscessus]
MTAGSASRRDTCRCRVGRPVMIAWRGVSSGSASGCRAGPCMGAVGSATVGRCASSGRRPAPCPDTTTVSGVRSISSGTSRVAYWVAVHGAPPARPAGSASPSARSGTSGSRSGMSKCTGPALPERVPRAAASTRHTAERHTLFCWS